MPKKPLHTKHMLERTEDFEAAYKANQPLIYRFLFWRTKDQMVAEDLTSEVFQKAWRARSSFSGGSVPAWLHRIARNTLIDHWRQKRPLISAEIDSLELPADGLPLDEALDQALRAAQLQRAVAKLPPEMRSVVELRFMQGLSAREAGGKLGLSEGNIRIMQYRALKKLREYLQ
jgi:RNA polymerase sigma-70 factor (ECF subfamily)